MRLTQNFATAALKMFCFFSEEEDTHNTDKAHGGEVIVYSGNILRMGKVAEIGSHFPLRNPVT